MAKSKWIEHAAADDPVEQVAGPVLQARLGRVWELLARAADTSQNTAEDVHQLRVATRRAMATMENFAALLPPRRAVWMNKQLNQIRKAANDVRDLDVLAERVARLARDNACNALTALLNQIEQRRQKAQQPIEDILEKLSRRGFSRRVRKLRKRVRLRNKYDKLTRPTYGMVARQALQPLVEVLVAASLQDPNDNAALHALRIQGKRLRYAIEVFAGAFDPSLRKELYPAIEQLQNMLGDVNDHATARDYLAGWLANSADAEVSNALRRMIDHEQVALEDARQRFVAFWTPERRQDLRRRFEQILAPECSTSEPMVSHDAGAARSAVRTGQE